MPENDEPAEPKPAYQHAARKRIIKLNLTSLIFFAAEDLSLHKALENNTAVQFGLFHRYTSNSNAYANEFAITPEFRFYLDEYNAVPTGFYIAPFLRYIYSAGASKMQFYDLNKTEIKKEITEIKYGGGISVGYQYTNIYGYSFDSFASFGRFGGSHTDNYSDLNYKSNWDLDFQPALYYGISIGYAF
ncbi:MAG: DUF3575 domain-containing protein [Bacteroidota bacterium]